MHMSNYSVFQYSLTESHVSDAASGPTLHIEWAAQPRRETLPSAVTLQTPSQVFYTRLQRLLWLSYFLF